MKNWTNDQTRFIIRHGGRVDPEGVAHLPKNSGLTYGESITHPGKRSLMIPGCVLIIEGLHFVID